MDPGERSEVGEVGGQVVEEKEMAWRRYCLFFGVALLAVVALGCATSPFHESPRDKCLAQCEAEVEDCKEGCENSSDFEPGAAQCVDQCEKKLTECNQKCPK
jgi:hypothetical protein